MIRSIKIELNAAFPNMPLLPFNVFHGSAAAITVLNVPRRIEAVVVRVVNVAGKSGVFSAQRSGSAWTATIPGEFLSQPGTSGRGVKIEGADELGNVFTLGAGDLIVLQDDGTIIPVSPPTTDDTVTRESPRPVKSSGIWSWVKSLLPHWLTSDYAEPATVESVATKADKTALDDKRDKDDLAVYEVVRTENTDWTWTSDDAQILSDFAAENVKPKKYENWSVDPIPIGYSIDTYGQEPHNSTVVTYIFNREQKPGFPEFIEVTATRPRYMDETLGPAKENQQLAAVATGDAQTPANGDLVKYDATNDRFVKAVAGVDFRDSQDNTCHKTEYGEWVADLPAGYTFEQESTIHYDGNNSWSVIVRIEGFGPSTASATGPEDATFLNFRTTFGSTFTATRTAVCSDGKRFVTEDFAAKKSDIFGNDGKPSDMFTTDLLGKKVANIKANSSAFAPEYDATSGYAVDKFVWHDGNIYQCKTAIAEGGEPWNAEHWEMRKLNDFFTESNSLLNGRLAYSRNATGLKDRAFNTLSFDGTEYNLSTALAAVTPTASGQPRDLLIVATATAATTISFTAGTIKGDKPTIDGAGTWLITLTEYAANTWYCRQIKMEDAA